jgi:hypothetical protein
LLAEVRAGLFDLRGDDGPMVGGQPGRPGRGRGRRVQLDAGVDDRRDLLGRRSVGRERHLEQMAGGGQLAFDDGPVEVVGVVEVERGEIPARSAISLVVGAYEPSSNSSTTASSTDSRLSVRRMRRPSATFPT